MVHYITVVTFKHGNPFITHHIFENCELISSETIESYAEGMKLLRQFERKAGHAAEMRVNPYNRFICDKTIRYQE